MAQISRALLSQEAKDYVRRAVASGTFPGESRVSISRVAKELDISPTPIREGLVQLVAEGFLEQLPNRGFHVLPLTLREVAELYPIGSALEDLGLRTVPFPGPDRMAELRCLNSRLQDNLGKDPEAVILDNQAWHRLLLEGCDNRQLMQMVAQLRARTFRYEYVCYAFDRAEFVGQISRHEQILDALAAGDREAARAAMRQHWQENLELVIASGKSLFVRPDHH